MQNRSWFVALTVVLKKLAFRFAPVLALLPLLCPVSRTQQAPETVDIHVQADQSDGAMPPIWNYWGYDEPNYTYPGNGKKLLGEFSRSGVESASHGLHYLRAHEDIALC